MIGGAGDGDGDAIARAELVMALRRGNVAGRAVLSALESVPRSLFLDAAHRSLGYADRAAPIDCGQTISQPTVVAMMTEALALDRTMRVLEIGTGSGYQTAVLARLAGHVFSLERYNRLSRLAGERLSVLRIENVSLFVADGFEGLAREAPFDRIIITAAAPQVPVALSDQLGEGGLVVAPVGDEGSVQHLTRFVKRGRLLEGEVIAPVRFVPMLPGVSMKL